MSQTREINFEDTVFDHLKTSPLYISRKSQNFNLDYLLDLELLETFIRITQPTTWKKLERQFPENTIQAIAQEYTKLRDKRGILNLIREGFTLQGANIQLIFFKPANNLNPDHFQKYQNNQFSVTRQVRYSPHNQNELDLVIAINGIPIITLELKNEFTGQNITHATEQYSKDRDRKDPFLKNCLVHFAVDDNTVMMTTKLENENTLFSPFNRDTKNPIIPDNALLKNAEPPLEFMNKLSKDKGLENCLVSYFFQKLMNEITITDDRQNDIS